MSKPFMGAIVRYCGHQGTFVADIFEIAGVNVVRANFNPRHGAGEFNDRLNRDPEALANATHQLTDFPNTGFWRPDIGVFVVPVAQVKEIGKGRKQFDEPKLKR